MNKLAIYGGSKSIKKKFNLGATYFEEELNAVCEVIRSNTISGFVANSGPKFYGGEKVKELENQFRKYFNSKYSQSLINYSSRIIFINGRIIIISIIIICCPNTRYI